MANFLANGGEVKTIPRGCSAHNLGEEPTWLKTRVVLDPATKRTPIPEVLKTMEERRLLMKKNKQRKLSVKIQPKQKIIFDDFGEPIRKIWVDG